MERRERAAVRYEVAERIATITFDQPEVLNPMTAEMIEDSIAALDVAASDPDVAVVVITGAGRAFSAGGDIRGLGSGAGDRDDEPTAFDRRAWLRRTQRLIVAIRAVEKPVIAAVNGVAAGGECDIALACDIRFMAAEARIGEVTSRDHAEGIDAFRQKRTPRFIGR